MDENKKRHEEALSETLCGIKKSFISDYVKAIYLYGSYVRGDYSWDSDIDLLMVLREDALKNRKVKKEIIWLKGNLTGEELDAPEIDLKVVFGDEWQKSTDIYYKTILEEGVNVWERL